MLGCLHAQLIRKVMAKLAIASASVTDCDSITDDGVVGIKHITLVNNFSLLEIMIIRVVFILRLVGDR